MSNKKIEKLQYITHQSPSSTHCELIQKACLSGVKWVQLRVKNAPYEEWLRYAQNARHCSRETGATLIINDHVEIAKEVGADGVHLGKTDMPPIAARKILGKDAIIGGTANTFEDIQELAKQGVDYIGVGPFRFTITKENLSPILGLEGYQKIAQQCREAGITTPLIAIGGIRVEDVSEILGAGMYGIAAASAIGYGEISINAERFIEAIG